MCRTAARVTLVLRVQDPRADVIVAHGAVAETRHQIVVVAACRLEEPAAHGLEHRRQRVERLLDAREPAQRPVEAEQVVRRLRGVDEPGDQLEGLTRDVGEAVPHEVEVVRPRQRLEGAQRLRERVAPGGELLRELRRVGRVKVTLNPAHPLERSQERRQEPADRVDHLGSGRHARSDLTTAGGFGGPFEAPHEN